MYKIGVIARPDITINKNEVWEINEEIRNIIIKNNGLPVIILPIYKTANKKMSDQEFNSLKSLLIQCDGFIFQGGDDYNNSDLQILDYCYKKNIPTLGICLGMQTMGCYLGYDLKDISTNINHYQKEKEYVHLVRIFPGSKLFNIIKESEIKVNSRHNQCLSKATKYICAVSGDDVIEAIEDKTKDFFIGVQWHPESMIEYDKVSCKLFSEFFRLVVNNYENKKVIGNHIDN